MKRIDMSKMLDVKNINEILKDLKATHIKTDIKDYASIVEEYYKINSLTYVYSWNTFTMQGKLFIEC